MPCGARERKNMNFIDFCKSLAIDVKGQGWVGSWISIVLTLSVRNIDMWVAPNVFLHNIVILWSAFENGVLCEGDEKIGQLWLWMQWEKEFPISSVPSNKNSFYCIPCRKTVSCGHMSKADVQRYCCVGLLFLYFNVLFSHSGGNSNPKNFRSTNTLRTCSLKKASFCMFCDISYHCYKIIQNQLLENKLNWKFVCLVKLKEWSWIFL